VRGDARAIERHLVALESAAPHAVRVYVELCRSALELAVRSGRLTEDARRSVDEVLDRWS
jgi:predicted short-subunit dehydrogenase-like oxidoreductase (DUF2520 family)